MYNYEARLADCSSLLKLADEGTSRIVNDMTIFNNSAHKHSKVIKNAGYKSSYTMPMLVDGKLLGFVFANSYTPNALNGELRQRLKLVTQLIESWINLDFYRIGVLRSTIKSTKIVSDIRDPEIAIADNIMLKAGRFSSEEFNVMKTHTTIGAELANKLIALYNLTDIPHVSMLTNIIRCHHEKLDGSGYPDGLSGDEIPIESKITMVADIFDALTSARPYKEASSNE